MIVLKTASSMPSMALSLLFQLTLQGYVCCHSLKIYKGGIAQDLLQRDTFLASTFCISEADREETPG